MSDYSVAEARNSLPSLLDQALEGERVVITRHGRPIAQLCGMPSSIAESRAAYERLAARRRRGPKLSLSGVDLLRQMYEEDRT